MGPSEMYEVPIEETDEAEFDPEELERGALKGLWEEPLEESLAPLEVIERPDFEQEAVRETEQEPISTPAAEAQVRPRTQLNRGHARKPDAENAEEQFYLEPI